MKIDLLVDVACVIPGIQTVIGLGGFVYNLAKRVNDAIETRNLIKNYDATKYEKLGSKNVDRANHNNGMVINVIRAIPVIGSVFSLYRIVNHIRLS